jgi:hypothetical protein
MNHLTTITPGSPAAIGTWDGARKWITAATRFEQCKLFCQVMLGFELMALRKTHGIEPGGDRKSASFKANSHDGNLIAWEDVLVRETGLAQSTAYRFMDMAKAAAPRLKKLAALKDFVPGAQPIAALPAPQQEALETAVKKLTDGHTQKEFGESLGLWKKPQGSGATGRKPGEGGRKKLSLSEQAELLKLQAIEDWKALEKSHTAYRHKFTVLTDLEVTAQIAALEKALTARKTWLKQPLNARDPKAIEALFQ